MLKNIEKLIEEKKYAEIKQILNEMNDYDIAEIFEDLPTTEQLKIFRLLQKDIAADVFSYMETDTQSKLITLLSEKEAVDIINDMASDDAADLMDEIPANVVSRLLNKVSVDARRDINQLLNYPEDSAGSIMTTEYMDLKEENTISDAIKKIKREYDDKETIDICFVTDKSRKLIGTVKLKDLVLNDENKLIKEIMDDDIMSVNTLMDQEKVAQIIQDYDLTSVPVVDSENKLVGIITIDDVIDIIEEEATEDIEKMAAITPTEKPYLKSNVLELYKSRIPWLLLLMISATFTGKIIQHYEVALASYVVLTSFIPMLMDTGGNAGGQSSVTIIRGLSLNDIEYKDTLKVIWKEIRVAILVGLTLAVANFIKLLFIDKVTTSVALVVCLTLIITVMIAKIIGCSLPILAKKIGFDPAVMASPFITTIVDAISLIVYFQIATHLLGL
ncbi:MAG: magnesium transporter [Bacilli bacterium]|nr:magnesium transporter [Bacilli bacterium]